jgi:hypothetical protein
MAMQWHDLLFMHWPMEVQRLRRVVPGELQLDVFDGHAWLGVVPFMMRRVRLRGLPAVWGLSAFEELNVRTYVTVGGKAGVYFFSLDAASRLAVRGARLLWGLPYMDARMHCRAGEQGWVEYRCERTHRGEPAARFEGRYRPTGQVYRSQGGTLDYFLTERYALYTAGWGRVMMGEIDHAPWPLQAAQVEVETMDMTRLLGLELPGVRPVCHFALRLEVRAWRPRRVRR